MLYWKGAEHWAFLQLIIIILSASKKKHYLVHIQRLQNTVSNVSTRRLTKETKTYKGHQSQSEKFSLFIYSFIHFPRFLIPSIQV